MYCFAYHYTASNHRSFFTTAASVTAASIPVLLLAQVLIGDARLASQVADALLLKGLFVVGFSFPVVPKGQARIRTQVSAVHSREDLAFAIEKFAEVKQEFGL